MELSTENILIMVKSKLREEGVELWTPPYYENEESSEVHLENLAVRYSEELGITYRYCLIAIRECQHSAIDNLTRRNLYRDTGIATLKIRVPNQQGGTELLNINTVLNVASSNLKSLIADQLSVSKERLKLICKGRVLKDDEILSEQSVKHGMQMMAVVLADINETHKEEKRMKLVNSTKADIKLLSEDDSYLQLENQSGCAFELPKKERNALITAMALHAKGTAALQKEDYALALILFLEADEEFSICNKQILQSIDNYALLNLDIAWCYLRLKSVSQIPDAEYRLKTCEENFHRCYGPNMERLMYLKGNTGNESALFMRLHLLQGIVKFHQNERPAARTLLLRAQRELQDLKVDNNSLAQLMELGFSLAEARLGLRAVHGDLNSAAEYINRSRDERNIKRQEAEEERKLEKERKKLGKCADGKQYVEPKNMKTLRDMGYSYDTARLALKQANNVVSNALDLIQQHPEWLQQPSTSASSSTQSSVQIVAALGFDVRMAKAALKKHNNDIDKATEDLINSNGIIEGVALTDDENDTETESNSTGDSSSSLSNDEKPKPKKELSEEEIKQKRKLKEEKEQREMEALERFREGISMVDDDHLDMPLLEEEEILKQYLQLVL